MDEMEYRRNTPMLAAGEAILWRGKPKRGAFIATKSLTMLPIAVVWLAFDMQFILVLFDGGGSLMMLPFFALHLMPVWIWLGNVITARRRWTNTNYYVTNRRIIIQGGFLAVEEKSLFYKDIHNIQVKIGLLDKLFGTGDVLLDMGAVSRKGRVLYTALEDLENPNEVYHRVQKIILDMQTDMEFPNAYRPETNPGYNTDYRP